MTSLRNLVLFSIILGVIGATFLLADRLALPIFLSVFTFMLLTTKDDVNFRYLVGTIILFSLIELILSTAFNMYIYKQYTGYFENCVIYTIHLFIDLSVAYCISNRKEICLKYTHKKNHTKHAQILEKSILDAPLLGVYILFCLVDILALGENFIRNLERIGISEEFAKQFWHVQYIYDYYRYLKYVLLSLVILLFVAVFIRGRSSRTVLEKA